MHDSFEQLKRTWQTLGRDDPFWDIVSLADKRGGKWDVREFLQTGDRDVGRYHEILKLQAGCPDRFPRAGFRVRCRPSMPCVEQKRWIL
jgi:hypothetical protein